MKGLLNIVWVAIISAGTVMGQGRPDPAVPQGQNLGVPESWEVRLDHGDEETVIGADPDSSDIYFVNMTPGWHITTGPAGIFYHPENTAEGEYKVQVSMHLFDPAGRNREGYGLFFGGTDLKGENQEYYYFLLRNTGEFLIKKRTGEDTEVIQTWTADDSINVFSEGEEESSVNNQLIVDVGEDTISFFINGSEVASMDNNGWETDGVYGLRVNHSVNLHVSDLALME